MCVDQNLNSPRVNLGSNLVLVAMDCNKSLEHSEVYIQRHKHTCFCSGGVTELKTVLRIGDCVFRADIQWCSYGEKLGVGIASCVLCACGVQSRSIYS